MTKVDSEKIELDEQKNLESILEKEKAEWRQKTCLQKVSRRLKNRIIRSHEFRDNDFVVAEERKDRPKIVVYSCVTGNYDETSKPRHTFGNIDYVIFTDDKVKLDGWTIRAIPKEYRQETPALTNRYIKMHPYELFAGSDYEYSIYVDGNIEIVGDLTPMTYVTGKFGLAMHRHAMRDDIRKEVYACIAQKKGNKKKLLEQLKRYKKAGFPKKYGMLECNVIVTDLKNQYAKKILESWWSEFLRSGSMRDQIAMPYILWKKGYAIENIGNLGYNVYRNPKLRKREHKL